MSTARPPGQSRLVPAAILGGFDGAASLIGVTVYLAATRHPLLIFAAALSGALSAAVSMGGGEFLSDSDSGLQASAVMAAATFTGALLPAVPFAFGFTPVTVTACAVTCAMIVLTVAALQPSRRLPRALAETAALLTLAVLVALACARLLPGGTA